MQPHKHNITVHEAVAAPAIDNVRHRPYQFRSGPTTRHQEATRVKLKSPLKFSLRLIT